MGSGNGLGPAFEGLGPEDMSHAMLLAVLMHNGGHYDLPLSAFEPDALEGPSGFHAVQMAPIPGELGVRLSVRTRPQGPDAMLTVLPVEPPPAE
jgi:hypothetical protein